MRGHPQAINNDDLRMSFLLAVRKKVCDKYKNIIDITICKKRLIDKIIITDIKIILT